MTIAEALKEASSQTDVHEAAYLLATLLQIETGRLYACADNVLSSYLVARYRELLFQRAHLKLPSAYLAGRKDFYDATFAVDQRVLIPRPETELLVSHGIEYLKAYPQATVWEIGVGSGAVLLSLAQKFPHATYYGSDISRGASLLAVQNAARLGLLGNVEVRVGDLFAPFADKGQVDLIVANLPYLTTASFLTLQKEVEHEPRVALDGGNDGLRLYRRFAMQLPLYLKQSGLALLEIGYDQGQTVPDILAPQYRGEVFKDLAGHTRMVLVRGSNVNEGFAGR